MYFFHRTDSIPRSGRFILSILLVLTLLMFMPACSRDNADNLGGPVPADSSEEPDKSVGQAPGAFTDNFTQERQKDIDRLNELQRKLIALQQKVLEENPGMREEQQDLQNTLESKLAETLAARNVDTERIKELQETLQNPDLPEEEKGTLIGEFQSQAQLYNQARAEAMNDEQVQEKYMQYVAHMQAKMEEVDPEAPAMTKEFEALQSRLQPRQ